MCAAHFRVHTCLPFHVHIHDLPGSRVPNPSPQEGHQAVRLVLEQANLNTNKYNEMQLKIELVGGSEKCAEVQFTPITPFLPSPLSPPHLWPQEHPLGLPQEGGSRPPHINQLPQQLIVPLKGGL